MRNLLKSYRSRRSFFSIASVFLVALLSGCSTHLSPEDLRAYVADDTHGLHKTFSTDRWIAELQYKPSSFLDLDLDMHDSFIYLELMVHPKENSLVTLEERTSVAQEMAYKSYQMLQVVTESEEEVPMVDAFFLQDYQSDNRNHLLCAFRKPKFWDRLIIRSPFFSMKKAELKNAEIQQIENLIEENS